MNNKKTIDIKPLPGYVLIKNVDSHKGCCIGVVAVIGDGSKRHFFKKDDIVFFDKSWGLKIGAEQQYNSGLGQYLVKVQDIFAVAKGKVMRNGEGITHIVLY